MAHRYRSITISTSSSSTRLSGPETNDCLSTVPRRPLPTRPSPQLTSRFSRHCPRRPPRRLYPNSAVSRAHPMTPPSPRLLTEGGMNATSISTPPASGRLSTQRRTTRRRSVGIPAAMHSSSRGEKCVRGSVRHLDRACSVKVGEVGDSIVHCRTNG